MLEKLMEVLVSEYNTRAILENLADCLERRSIFLTDAESRAFYQKDAIAVKEGIRVLGEIHCHRWPAKTE